MSLIPPNAIAPSTKTPNCLPTSPPLTISTFTARDTTRRLPAAAQLSTSSLHHSQSSGKSP
ncbi:hypothetical protein Hypma_003701 [Hypsizygus marmoreus]|uniref:Uncharacterized protein n=1 Tax=Hypsizygus marmoreus TaxID=39966 RepID=A0A369J3Q9_HYPMA|nr:hypothetical protein Hypma_003701 [Hypsizygus marmoreus]